MEFAEELSNVQHQSVRRLALSIVAIVKVLLLSLPPLPYTHVFIAAIIVKAITSRNRVRRFQNLKTGAS